MVSCMKLSIEDLMFLKSELDKTEIINEEGLKYIKSAHNYMYLTVHNITHSNQVLDIEKCWFYTLKNENLNKFICNKFDESIDNLYTIHRLVYSTGGACKRHTDRFTTHKTISILLSSDFIGGEMYINDKDISLTNAGDCAVFNGGEDYHEVKEIIKGERDVLIIWFSKKKAKFSVI